jgi:hypothetical protein
MNLQRERERQRQRDRDRERETERCEFDSKGKIDPSCKQTSAQKHIGPNTINIRILYYRLGLAGLVETKLLSNIIFVPLIFKYILSILPLFVCVRSKSQSAPFRENRTSPYYNSFYSQEV